MGMGTQSLARGRRNLPHGDLRVLRSRRWDCVTGLKLSGQLHMVASVPVVS